MSEFEERLERQAVIAAAWTWVGTRFNHRSDVKKRPGDAGAADCAMWLRRAFIDCGLIEPFDPGRYFRLWFLHHSEERYLEWLNKFCAEIPAEEAQPGDIVIYKYGLCYSHAGLIISDQLIIHAWFVDEQVRPCERFDIRLTHYGSDTPSLRGKPRPVKYFSFWKKKALASAVV